MQPHAELRSLIARHARIGQVESALAGVRLAMSRVPTETIHHVTEPALAVVAQGAKRALLGDTAFDYGAGQYLVVSVDLPILAVSLRLRPAAIATLLLESAGDVRAAGEPAGMGVSDAPPDLLDAVTRLLRLLDRPQDIGVLAPMLEREILWRLLTGAQGAMLRQIGLADSRLSQIGHAIRWIRAHYAEALRIDDLAGVAAMSASSLHRHFRAVTAMSPLQYQKYIRLQEARARLLAAAEDVATVGFAVGYDSPSQFSREYSRLFGAPPGRDAARLRAAVAPARLVA
jgi:AraC-like DNA-binding protein